MKRKLQKMIALLAILFVPFFLSAQEYGSILNESFEEGIPSTWTQENVSGNVNWVAETGGNYPKGAYFGEKRVAFRSNATVSTNAVTRLVTPVLDGFSSLRDPILVFAHAQDKWTNDFDTLKVLYRSAGMKDWAVLKVYDHYMARWDVDTLSLTFVAGAKDFQIAFQASDNLGRGVVLDNVEVRSAPSCFTPEDIAVKNITNNSAEITWFGAWDAESFSIKVSTTPLSDADLNGSNKADVKDEEIASEEEMYLIDNLAVNTKYYFYLRTNCYGEYSKWHVDSFQTYNLLELPYVENFNLKANPGFADRLPRWYYGASEGVAEPFINTGHTGYLYEYSADSTFALMFYGQEFSNHPTDYTLPVIPERAYAYAAMPKIKDTDKIQDLQVSFWSVAFYAAQEKRPSNIIVGIMDDPEDVTTFTAVDTIISRTPLTRTENIVSFENYKGEGRYVAFLSLFETENKFSMDNLVLSYRPKVAKINDFKIGLPASNTLKINILANVAYSKYDVVVATKQIPATQLDTIASDSLTTIIRKEIVDGGTIDVDICTEYYVYLRGKEGTDVGEWSNYQYVHTPGIVREIPYVFDYKVDTLGRYYSTPYTYTIKTGNMKESTNYMMKDMNLWRDYYNPTSGSNALTVGSIAKSYSSALRTTPFGFDMYGTTASYTKSLLIFPEIENRDSARIEFFAGAGTTYSAGYLRIGFMSDANDPATFEEVDKIFLPKGGYEYFFWDMEQYKDKGPFFAVMADAADWQGYLLGFLDEVQVVKIPTCRDATNVEVVFDGKDNHHVELKWDAEGVSEWIVNLYTGETADVKSLVLCDTVDTAYIDFTNLDAPGYTYCYTIQPICGETQGRISLPKSFTTTCLDQEKLPYFEDFEDPSYKIGNKVEVFAAPCMYSQLCKYGSGTNAQYTPYINNAKLGSTTTNKIYFQKSSTFKYRSTYVALPKMEKPVKELQISFDYYSANSLDGVLRVGVMTDPMDSLTIEEVALIYPKEKSKWINYVVTLNSYTGTGEHIVIGLAGKKCTSSQAMYVDNIKVEVINQCSRPENLELKGYGADYAELGWTNPTKVSEWAVLFASAEMTDKDFALMDTAVCDKVLRLDTVKANPATIKDLKSNTTYYVYVKSICGADGSSEWCYPIKFRTACDVRTPEEMGVEQFDDYGYGSGKAPDCWVVGNSTVGASASYIPQCASSNGHTKGSLYINSTALGNTPYNGAYAITPLMGGVEDISKYRLRLWGTASSATYMTDKYAHSIIVGVVTNPSNLATFERIDTLVFDVEKRPYEVYFDKYEGDYLGGSGKYIMFLSEFDKDNRVYIDEVEVTLAPECRTDFDFRTITESSVEVEVLAGKAPYQLICAEKMYADSLLSTLEAVDIKKGNTYTINDLKANKDYYVYMRSTCGKDWSDWSLVKVVRTECSSTVSLPYTEGFESNKTAGQGVMPECWNYVLPEDDYTLFYVYSSSSYLGSRNMLIETKSAVKQPYLVSQGMDIDNLSKCTMTFYGKPYSSSSSYFKTPYVVVGVVEDLNNIERSFVPVDTVMLEATAWTKFEISFENYKGSGKNIGFVSPFSLNGKQARYYLDEIYVEVTPTCLRPDNFSFVTATDTSVTLSFEHKGAMKYEVKAGLRGFDMEDESEVVSVAESTETTINVGGFLPGRTYDFYVRAVCSESDASPWAYAGNAKTLEEYVKSLPYYCNFEKADENSSWITLDDGQTDKWYIGIDDEHTIAENYEPTDSALYISYDGGTTAQYFNFLSKDMEKEGKENGWVTYNASYAYRTIYFEPGVYTISYKWKCEGLEGSKGDVADYAKVALVPVSSTFNPGGNIVTNKNGNRSQLDHCSNGGGLGSLDAETIVDYFDLTQSLCAAKAHGCDYCYALHGSSEWRTAEKTITVTPANAGAYNMVFFWFNQDLGGDETVTRPAPAFDDIAIVPQTCVAPYGLNMTLFDHESVDLTWIPFGKSTGNYQLLLASTDTVKVDLLDSTQVLYNDSSITTTNVHIAGLTPSTTYYAYVRLVCGEGEFSDWVGPFEFTTACAPFVVDSVYSFEGMQYVAMKFAADGSYGESSNTLPQCFIAGNSNSKVKQTTSYRSYFPSMTSNGSGNTTLTTHYNRSGEYKDGRAIKFRHTSADNAGGYLVLPLFDGEMDDMYLNFWMRCVVHNDFNQQFKPGMDNMTSTTLLEGVASNASRKITVGSMTNPNDPTTFKAANVFEYPYTEKDITAATKITDDPTGNDYWVRFSMPLKGLAGKYIVFKDEMYNDGCKFNVVYIDDIEVTYRTCAAPSGLSVDSIRMNSAVLNVTQQSEASEFVIQLASDNAFENVIREQSVTTFPVKLDKLPDNTQFFVRIKSICSEYEQSEWSAPYVFKTLHGVVYDQNFNEVRLCPEDWNRSGGNWKNSEKPALLASDVLGKNTKFSYLGADEKGEHWQPESWQFKEKLFASGMFTSNHMAVTMTGRGAHWLFSPVIDLNNPNDKYHLSFDLALTDMGTSDDIFGNFITNLESQFMVAISDDAGETWKIENTTVWGTARDAYLFHSIPTTGRTYSIDLSKHAGKTIMIAFYTYTNFDNSNDAGDLHIDNVHVNAYKENPLTTSICESVDFNNDQFSIISDDMEVGENKFESWELSHKAGTYDTYHTLNLNVKEMIVTNLLAEICESREYSGYGFLNLKKPGVYKQKLTSSNGCDSLVVLELSSIPTIRTEVYDSICQGGSLTWNGKVYNRTGIYSDTLVSKVTGCDSIASLVLKVRDVLRYDSYVNICFGDTLVFGDKEITETGRYEHTFKTADGCDSLVTLYATVLPDYTNIVVNAVIEEGEVYNENGFFGISKPGKYTLSLTTSDGCDSIITLNLIVGNATHYMDVNICNGETYQFGSQVISETGQYLETFAEDSIVFLNATVLPDLRQTIDAYICKGEVYNENGFSGKSETGIYTLPLTSVDGCDSTITLNLTVLKGDTTRITKEIYTDELPYENKELGLYYDGATKPGTYTDVIELEAANCKDVIVHTLIVKLADALVDVMATDLVLYPNPVNVSETLYIDAEFTTTEREGLLVEVFNTVGQKVYTTTPSQYPIEITGLKDSGVYIVRVQAGNGNIYQGKVIVK